MKLKESIGKVYWLFSGSDFTKCGIPPGSSGITASFEIFARKHYYHAKIASSYITKWDNHGRVFKQYLVPGETTGGKR